MKLLIKFMTLIMTVAMFAGCARAVPEGGRPAAGNPGSSTGGQGITVNKISFEEVRDEAVPESLKDKIENLKAKRGYIFEQRDGYFYVVIFSGEKNTGGYGIKVKSVEDIEGKTKIIVEETAPKEGDMVTQAFTYPYIVVRMKGVTDNFQVENTKGEKFTYLKD
jgi:hypothetical protein